MASDEQQFIELVARMRDAQRAYFRQRHATALDKARQLEREVDLALVRLAGRGLFDGDSTRQTVTPADAK